jgi:acetyl esterase
MKVLYREGLLFIWIFSLASIVLTFGFLQYSLAQTETNATFDNSVKSSNNVTNVSNYTMTNNQSSGQIASNYFMYPTQKNFFSQSTNSIKEADRLMLSGQWTPEQSRAIAEGLKYLVREQDKPKMISVKDYYVPSSEGNKILLRVYDPGVKAKPSPLLIFVHGGGSTVGNVDIFDDSIRRVANSSGLLVAAMDYRLAPEHPFPAGLIDVVSAVRWLSINGKGLGIDTSRMALGGDSAGANLALATALMLRDSHLVRDHNLVQALYLLYGPYSTDLLNRESMKIFGNGEFGLTYAQMKWVMNQTFQNTSDYQNPLAFPLLSKNLKGLPPVYIAAMALDPLRDESIVLANRLQQEGQEYYLTIWPGVGHGALSTILLTPQIQKYLDAMTVYLRAVLSN